MTTHGALVGPGGLVAGWVDGDTQANVTQVLTHNYDIDDTYNKKYKTIFDQIYCKRNGFSLRWRSRGMTKNRLMVADRQTCNPYPILRCILFSLSFLSSLSKSG